MKDKLINNNGKFYEWLRRQRQRTDGVGDFARYVFWDKNAPRHRDSPDKWRDYCRGRDYPFMVSAFEQSWHEFSYKEGRKTVL